MEGFWSSVILVRNNSLALWIHDYGMSMMWGVPYLINEYSYRFYQYVATRLAVAKFNALGHENRRLVQT